MKIGFTGTSQGMTEQQKVTLTTLLRSLGDDDGVTAFAHGDCIGADAEAANLIREFLPEQFVIVHPPVDETHRAFCVSPGNVVLPPLTHFARNRAIVDSSDLVIGYPCQMSHQTRGGTWYTLDYARKKGKKTIIVWPDGTMAKEDGKDCE